MAEAQKNRRDHDARPGPDRAEWLAIGILLAASLAAFSPVLSAGFVNWDDPHNVLNNERIRAWNAGNLAWMWTARPLGVYEPIGWMVKTALVTGFGLRAGPFHVASWVLHAVNAALVFLIARRLIERAGGARGVHWPATVAAALFALHPLRVECVAWVSGQPYVLSATAAFAALLAYLRYVERNESSPPLLAALLFLVALGAKIAAFPLAAALVVIDCFPLRRIGGEVGWWSPAARRVWLEKLWFVVPALAAASYVAAAPTVGALPREESGVAARLLEAGQALCGMFGRALLPVGLSPFYPPRHGLDLIGYVGLATLVALIGWSAWRGRAAAGYWAALLWAGLFLLPTMGLVRHGDHIGADRYTYFAFIGLAIAAGAAADRLRGASRGVFSLLIVGLAGLSVRQTRVWHDSERLWRHALAVDSTNWLAHNNLANLMLERRDFAAALSGADAALNLQNDYADAWFTRGAAVEGLGNDREAISAYERAVELVPFHVAAVNMAAAFQRMGKPDVAERRLRAAYEANPAGVEVGVALATLLMARGNSKDAESVLDELLRRQPESASAWVVQGQNLMRTGEWALAISSLDTAIELAPEQAESYYHRAFARRRSGLSQEAVQDYVACLERAPQRMDAAAELADLLVEQRRPQEAIGVLEQALTGSNEEPRIVIRLAWLLATAADERLRDPQRALTLAQALSERFKGGNAQALDTLAAAQAAAGDFAAAVATGERALGLLRGRGEAARIQAVERRLAGYRNGIAWMETDAGTTSRPSS